MKDFISKYKYHISIILYTFLVYGISVNYDFIMDDTVLILDNTLVQFGI